MSSTIIEFVSKVPGGGGDAAGGAGAQTGDFIGIAIAIICAVIAMVAGFMYFAQRRSAFSAANGKHVAGVSNNAFNAKYLFVMLAIVAALGCVGLTVSGVSSAHANDDNGICKVADKVTAVVDDDGSVSIENGYIKNDSANETMTLETAKLTKCNDIDDGDCT